MNPLLQSLLDVLARLVGIDLPAERERRALMAYDYKRAKANAESLRVAAQRRSERVVVEKMTALAHIMDYAPTTMVLLRETHLELAALFRETYSCWLLTTASQRSLNTIASLRANHSDLTKNIEFARAALAKYRAEVPRMVRTARQREEHERQWRLGQIEQQRNQFHVDLHRFAGVFDRFANGNLGEKSTILTNARYVLTPRGGTDDVWNHVTGRWNKAKWEYDPTNFNFVGLPFEAKAALLFPFLKYWVGEAMPLLSIPNSTTTRLVYVAEQGPIQTDKFRTLHAGDISGFLGGHWRIEPLDAQRLAVVQVTAAVTTQLPRVVQLSNKLMRKGRIFHGWNLETQEPYYVDLSGMRHTLVCGANWSGKTTGLTAIIVSLLASLDRIEALHLVDYSKRGLEFGIYRGLSPKVHVHKELGGDQGVWAMVAHLEALMQQRFADMERDGLPRDPRDYVVVIIDEAQAFWAMDTTKDNPDADQVKEFKRRMKLLGEQARAARIKLVLATQQPTADSIPGNVTANLTSRMIYKLVSPQVAQMLLGQTSQLPRSPQELITGQYLFIDDSSANPVTLIQTPFVAKPGEPGALDPRQFVASAS